MNRGFLLAWTLLLGACAAGEVPHPTSPAAARAVAEAGTYAAVARPGATVCRQLRFGIAERDWIRGEVVSAAGQELRVRIEDPGRFGQSLNGVPLARGVVVNDAPRAWVPCA